MGLFSYSLSSTVLFRRCFRGDSVLNVRKEGEGVREGGGGGRSDRDASGGSVFVLCLFYLLSFLSPSLFTSASASRSNSLRALSPSSSARLRASCFFFMFEKKRRKMLSDINRIDRTELHSNNQSSDVSFFSRKPQRPSHTLISSLPLRRCWSPANPEPTRISKGAPTARKRGAGRRRGSGGMHRRKKRRNRSSRLSLSFFFFFF